MSRATPAIGPFARSTSWSSTVATSWATVTRVHGRGPVGGRGERVFLLGALADRRPVVSKTQPRVALEPMSRAITLWGGPRITSHVVPPCPAFR